MWFHTKCAGLDSSELEGQWFCHNCAGIPDFVPASPLTATWGDYSGASLHEALDRIYSRVVAFKPNQFKLPSGKTGKAFVAEATRLIVEWNTSGKLERVALLALHLMGTLLLQKPGKRSKPSEESACLEHRLNLWHAGKFDDLVNECVAIQSKLPDPSSSSKAAHKGFSRLMMAGKVGAALRVLDTSPSAPLNITPEVVSSLKDKHPPAQPVSRQHLVSLEPPPKFEHAIFTSIDSTAIRRAASTTRGGAGPSGMSDALWRRMICSKAFGKESDALAHSIALMTRRLCTSLVDPASVYPLLSCRLIALNKNPGVRPIGIGEMLRRIVGRSVVQHLKSEIIEAAGPLQLASGQQGGNEAAVHAMNNIFSDDGTEGVLLADAQNAFNVLNRATALTNLRFLCPPLSYFAINLYRAPTKLFLYDGSFIWSSEGTTQGCNVASPWYCISLRPLITSLSTTPVKQIFFADDGAAAGKFTNLRKWWDMLCSEGPGFGYFPRADKSWLIVKPGLEEQAQAAFLGTEVRITSEGHRYLGAPIGTETFKHTFVKKKVAEWIGELNSLTNIAKSEPQTAFSAFSVGLSKRWFFIMRTTPGISELFEPLEEVLHTSFLPTTINRHITPSHRDVFALPARDGGVGVFNPVTTADTEYTRSIDTTAPLSKVILEQCITIEPERALALATELKSAKQIMVTSKRASEKKAVQTVVSNMSASEQRRHEELSARGASTWITTLPLQEHGFVLNKQEWWDAMAMRYGFELEGVPPTCGCGKTNSIEHSLSCARGGFVYMRHNQLRDLTANLLHEAGCKDVVVEPRLLPLTGEVLALKSANNANDARLDVSARSVWSPGDKTFLDFRVFNSLAPSNSTLPLDRALLRHEDEKKRVYNERVLEVEKSTFSPIVCSTTGIFGNEAQKFYRQVAVLLSNRSGQSYPDTIRYIRQRLSFCILKTTVASLRGFKGTKVTRFISDRNDINLLYIINNLTNSF